ncbi:hypothetical protein H2203_008745 [Taxawa tesnikishii (nom. ined.)]|nr:hypothetical protein H2203_008745 [Dothideales sp. JES 119]
MPHKHVRGKDDDPDNHRREEEEEEEGKKSTPSSGGASSDYKLDDTPKAFARLIQRQSQPKKFSGLDNGEERKSNKKRKRGADAPSVQQPPPKAESAPVGIPKILPGEKLSDYSARVDRALPIAGLARRGKGPAVPGLKERQTKTEKRLHKMYAEWREEDARIKEREEEAREQAEEEEEEKAATYGEEIRQLGPQGKKGKRKRMIGEVNAHEDDPWAELKKKRDAPKGLHDVAQAPPEFKVVPREKFKVKNNAIAHVADVPNAAGSLKRREELGVERKSIIEQYRALMKRNEGA